MVQTLAEKLDELLGDSPNYGRGKECNCVVLILAHLYNYKVGAVPLPVLDLIVCSFNTLEAAYL